MTDPDTAIVMADGAGAVLVEGPRGAAGSEVLTLEATAAFMIC